MELLNMLLNKHQLSFKHNIIYIETVFSTHIHFSLHFFLDKIYTNIMFQASISILQHTQINGAHSHE